MTPILTIIVPTWNNPQYLNPCVDSIYRTGILNRFANLIIVNNGDQEIRETSGTTVLKPGKNLGWEGGLKLALEHSSTPFVCFQNDDTFIPTASSMLYDRLLMPFMDKGVAAVGPMTTVAAGCQSVYSPISPAGYVDVRWLIFFTVIVRRTALDEVGGVDTSLPGGDDIDLSMRLRQAGHRLVVAPDSFLIHEAFKTGARVHGDHTVEGGWNSTEMTERTNTALIRKHGFRLWSEAVSSQVLGPVPTPDGTLESNLILNYSKGRRILELGCGNRKFFVESIGVDLSPKGEQARDHEERLSVADVVADVTKPMPFEFESFETIIASHILEHCLDPIETLKLWLSYLEPGGRLVIAVPDESVTAGIPLNPEHCHAYNETSLRNLLELLGAKLIESRSSNNGVSFVACFEKQPKEAYVA